MATSTFYSTTQVNSTTGEAVPGTAGGFSITTQDLKTVDTSTKSLVYPSNLFSRTQSVSPAFIKFNLLEVVQQQIGENTLNQIEDLAKSTLTKVQKDDILGAVGDVFKGGSRIITEAANEFVNARLQTKFTGKSVSMYMPGTIQINDSLVYENIDTKGLTELVTSMYNAGTLSIEGLERAWKTGEQAGKSVLAAHVLSKWSKSSGLAGGFAGNALIASGKTFNPATKLLFRSPGLRQFQLDFKFTPTSQAEAQIVLSIISFFRQSAYPQLTAGQALYKVPGMFNIKFGFKNLTHNPYLIHFKKCYCTQVTTTYNPSGIPAFFPDGSPVETNLTLTFQEAELNSASDIHGTSGGKVQDDEGNGQGIY